jgi:hypothetical protein
VIGVKKMAEKVKVSHKVSTSIKELETWIGVDKDRAEKVLKIAEILAYGHEVVPTPEEKLINLIIEKRKSRANSGDKQKNAETNEFIFGVIETLNILDIKIKEVNE